MKHRSGFVNIIGHPNVGKSTLMNQLVGEKLSIITSKAQTTRHRILGIVNEEDYQIIYSDTPGVIEPAYKLQEGMMKFVFNSLEDADLFLLMVECGQQSFKNEKLFEFLSKTETPIILLINKIDISNQEMLEEQVQHWHKQLPKAEVLPVSALHNFNVDVLKQKIVDKLPECPPYYPKDSLTDKTERFFVEEKIREKILLNYEQEVPYSTEVLVEEFKEEEEIIRIRANIFVSRDSQKGILIGKGGSKLKKVGSEARKDLEVFFEKKIYLNLFVKVNKDWRNDEGQLKRFGYL
ncbi:MAG: GTPase Era [Flavobacteriales bacterium]|nr:GTPase Era [Flavobacteriales bacterium]|tara:strand:- start:1994 stop:2872 length:879 start_codon:yes stop_codon:yes gene_type:complete